MQRQKLIGAALAAALCITPATQATAAAAEPYSMVSPLYEIAHDACSSLGINGSRASCTSDAEGRSAVKIIAEQYLQK